MANIQNSDNSKFGKHAKQLELSYTAGGNIKWLNHFEKQ